MSVTKLCSFCFLLIGLGRTFHWGISQRTWYIPMPSCLQSQVADILAWKTFRLDRRMKVSEQHVAWLETLAIGARMIQWSFEALALVKVFLFRLLLSKNRIQRPFLGAVEKIKVKRFVAFPSSDSKLDGSAAGTTRVNGAFRAASRIYYRISSVLPLLRLHGSCFFLPRSKSSVAFF